MKKRIGFKRIIMITLCVLIAAVLVAAGYLLADGARIPRLYFEGDIAGMESKEDIRNVSVRYKSTDMNFSGYAELKIQGTSSLAYEKKNFTIKFFEDEAHEEKLKLDMGWGAQNKYCLKANWIDRTHARNVVSAKLVSQMQSKYDLLPLAPCNGAVDGFPVEIYVNGDFHGLYTFNIPKDDWQFGMDSDNPNHIVIGGEGWKDANLFQAEPDFKTWEVEVGEDNEETLEKMKALFDFVINSSDEEFRANLDDHLDLDAALNYYVFSDYAYLTDNRGKNILLATYDGAKWYLSLYDLDTSWGTTYNGYGLLPYEEELVDMGMNNLFARLEKNYPEELAQRYFALRQDIFTKEHVMAEFEAFRQDIPAISFLKETIRWGSGAVRRPADLPGSDYSQIEHYLDSITDRLDAKYAAMQGN